MIVLLVEKHHFHGNWVQILHNVTFYPWRDFSVLLGFGFSMGMCTQCILGTINEAYSNEIKQTILISEVVQSCTALLPILELSLKGGAELPLADVVVKKRLPWFSYLLSTGTLPFPPQLGRVYSGGQTEGWGMHLNCIMQCKWVLGQGQKRHNSKR